MVVSRGLAVALRGGQKRLPGDNETRLVDLDTLGILEYGLDVEIVSVKAMADAIGIRC